MMLQRFEASSAHPAMCERESNKALVEPGQRQFRWQPSYHALGQVARFVPPGSAAAGLDYFAHVAFVRPDGGVVVVLNTTEADVDWSLVMGGDAWTLTTPAHALQARWLAVLCGGELELSSFSVGIWGS